MPDYFAALALAFGYLLGSIPFGLILTRMAGLGDVRKIGSGNIGATNVLRTGHRGLAAATLLLDALKGTAAVLIAARWGEIPALAAALGAFLGHCFPVWLGFKGGKGVATFIGALAGVAWMAAAAFAAIWLTLAAVTRYSSVAGMSAIAATPVVLYFLGMPRAAVLFLLLAAIALLKHRQNLSRLLSGQEGRIGAKG
jgi:glycerol-3-phosphate acyltransferase PlsY